MEDGVWSERIKALADEGQEFGATRGIKCDQVVE
jgi:hypothetical protein